VFAHREGSLADPLKVKTVQSRLDGLNHWVVASAIEETRHEDDDGRLQSLTVEVGSPELAVWQQI